MILSSYARITTGECKSYAVSLFARPVVPASPRASHPKLAQKSRARPPARQARKLRFDVSFQTKITALSQKLSRARSMKALDEI